MSAKKIESLVEIFEALRTHTASAKEVIGGLIELIDFATKLRRTITEFLTHIVEVDWVRSFEDYRSDLPLPRLDLVIDGTLSPLNNRNRSRLSNGPLSL